MGNKTEPLLEAGRVFTHKESNENKPRQQHKEADGINYAVPKEHPLEGEKVKE